MKRKKITIEYNLACTTQSLYRAISTSMGLREWFADQVDIVGNKYTFYWNKAPHMATLISQKLNNHIKFSWTDDQATYFEFRIEKSDLTNANTLVITDFSDPDEELDVIDLWNNQVEKLKRSIGCQNFA